MWTPFVDEGGTPQAEAMLEQAVLLECLSTNRLDVADQIGEEDGFFLIGSKWNPDSWAPSWALYSDGTGNVLLNISGTQNSDQCLAHLGGSVGVFPLPGVGQMNAAHYALLQQVLREANPYMRPNASALYVSGHSYGGSLTSILCCAGGPTPLQSLPFQGMTFGAPRSFFGALPTRRRGPLVRLSKQNNDPVAHLPPQHLCLAPGIGFVTKRLIGLLCEWGHIGRTCHIDDNGILTILGDDYDDEGIVWLARSCINGWGNHPIASYMEKLALSFGV
jgi:hypothetical protein